MKSRLCVFLTLIREVEKVFAYAAKTAADIAFYEMRRNLNSDASNLNLVARSFCEMPCSFFVLVFGKCKMPDWEIFT